MTNTEWLTFFAIRCPDWRMGQTIANAARMAEWNNPDVFYIPDEKLNLGFERLAEYCGLKKWR